MKLYLRRTLVLYNFFEQMSEERNNNYNLLKGSQINPYEHADIKGKLGIILKWAGSPQWTNFRDRLALIRDVGLTTGDTLAFSRAVRSHLDRFLSEDGIILTTQEKSALADIILRAAVGYGPLDALLHDRSVSEIMVNGPDEVFIERRGVLSKADVRFEDENQLLETIPT